MANKALLVGINAYESSPLRGCLNDVKYMSGLAKSFGYNDQVTLLDNKATYQNIIFELNELITSSVSGDLLLFHFSGHGCQIPTIPRTGRYESDGLDEAIVPFDYTKFGVIRDDDLYSILSKLPKGVILTCIFDCCHSGDGTRSFAFTYNQSKSIGVLGSDTGKHLNPINGAIREINIDSEMGDIILISGCQSNQTSADAFIMNEYQGALSYSIRKACESYKDATISNGMLVKWINNFMDNSGFTQNPVLECKEEYKERLFLK